MFAVVLAGLMIAGSSYALAYVIRQSEPERVQRRA